MTSTSRLKKPEEEEARDSLLCVPEPKS